MNATPDIRLWDNYMNSPMTITRLIVYNHATGDVNEQHLCWFWIQTYGGLFQQEEKYAVAGFSTFEQTCILLIKTTKQAKNRENRSRETQQNGQNQNKGTTKYLFMYIDKSNDSIEKRGGSTCITITVTTVRFQKPIYIRGEGFR